MTNTEFLCSAMLNMTLCAYLSKNPNHNVKRLAQKYRRQTSCKKSKSTLKMIANSRWPADTVINAYAKLSE